MGPFYNALPKSNTDSFNTEAVPYITSHVCRFYCLQLVPVPVESCRSTYCVNVLTTSLLPYGLV